MTRQVWYYERQAANAKKRADHFRDKTAPTIPVSIQSRGASKDYFYQSMLLKDGAAHRTFIVSVADAVEDKVSATQAGLGVIAAGNTEGALSIRGSGVKPTRVHWYAGDPTPSRSPSPWGTSVAKYYATTGGRSHYSIPFSKATGTFTASDITTAFNAVFGPAASGRTTLLGASNGRAHITWETARVSAQT